MSTSEEQQLIDTLDGLGYTSVAFEPGENDLVMLSVNGVPICNTEHALDLDADDLESLVEGALAAQPLVATPPPLDPEIDAS